MNTRTMRNLYYLGIVLLILYTLPAARKYFAFLLDYEVTPGVPVVAVVGMLTAIGAYFAYKRRFI